MKLKTIMSMVAMTLGCSGLAVAGSEYFPPEHIQCRLSAVAKLNCDGFDRQYLTEHTHTADFTQAGDKNLNFSSAVAYMDNDKWTVFVTYKDVKNKSVLLKTINYSIKPNISKQSWVNHKNEYYTCNTSYMACSMLG